MKRPSLSLHSGGPELAEPLTGWGVFGAWIAIICVTTFLIVGAWTVGNGIVSEFARLVAPSVTMPSSCER